MYHSRWLGGTVAVATGCEKLKARDHLNKGVQAFKNAKYTQAVDHFKEAVQLDPEFPTARLYLATAYMSQYIPGAESPENQQNATGGRAGVPEGSRNRSEEHRSHQLARVAALQPGCRAIDPGEENEDSSRKPRSGIPDWPKSSRRTKRPTIASALSLGESGIRSDGRSGEAWNEARRSGSDQRQEVRRRTESQVGTCC